MCKLAAMVNLENSLDITTTSNLNKFLDHIFYINSFGQQDGSGVMWMDKDGNHSHHKRAINAVDFLETRWWNKQSLANKRFVALHTRYATQGAVSDANAHPFEHGEFVLMQNGTAGVSPHHTALVPNKHSNCSVDSESVCWAFSEQGVLDTLDTYRGDGVFMFLNTRLRTFNIIKNNRRDLHVIQVTGKQIFLYATDAHALALAATRSNLPFEKVQVVPNDMWHVFDTNGNYNVIENITVKKYSPPPATNYVIGNAGNRLLTNGTTSKQGKYKATNQSRKPPVVGTSKVSTYHGDCCVCSDPVYSGSNHKGYRGTIHSGSVACPNCHELASEFFHDNFVLIEE